MVEIISRPALMSFVRGDVQPPSALYIDRDDRLFVRSHNSIASLTVEVRARILTPTFHQPSAEEAEAIAAGKLKDTIGYKVHPLVFRQIPSSDRASSFTSFDLTEGFLLGLTVFPDGAVARRGSTFVQVGLVRGGALATEQVQTLLADYLTERTTLGWPGGRILQSVDGPGLLRLITGTDPAAGAEIIETVPTNARWRVKFARFRLATDGTAANRRSAIIIDDGTSTAFASNDESVQTANLTDGYNFAPFGASRVSVAQEHWIPAPPDLLMLQGWRFSTSTVALQAGDNYTAPVFVVEEWIED